MKISIHTLKKTLFEGEAEKLIVHTAIGEITILDHHIPLISIVSGPSVEIVDSRNKKNIIGLSSGFLEVRPNKEVVILANT